MGLRFAHIGVKRIKKKSKAEHCMVVLAGEKRDDLRSLKDSFEEEFFPLATEDTYPCSQHAKHYLKTDGAIISCSGGISCQCCDDVALMFHQDNSMNCQLTAFDITYQWGRILIANLLRLKGFLDKHQLLVGEIKLSGGRMVFLVSKELTEELLDEAASFALSVQSRGWEQQREQEITSHIRQEVASNITVQ